MGAISSRLKLSTVQLYLQCRLDCNFQKSASNKSISVFRSFAKGFGWGKQQIDSFVRFIGFHDSQQGNVDPHHFWRQPKLPSAANLTAKPPLKFELKPMILSSSPSDRIVRAVWFDPMSSISSKFALKDFKLRTCDAFCRPAASLSARRLQSHLGTLDIIFRWLLFLDCVFFAEFGNWVLVVWWFICKVLCFGTLNLLTRNLG